MSLAKRFALVDISGRRIAPDWYESILSYETTDGDADEQFQIRIRAAAKVSGGPTSLNFTYEDVRTIRRNISR